jgi:predicted HicB family RNase H-like nuclease
MKNELLQYKGYYGTIELSKDNIIHGKIEFIEDLVNYEATSLEMLKKEFNIAVDFYLETCKRIGKEPDKP